MLSENHHPPGSPQHNQAEADHAALTGVSQFLTEQGGQLPCDFSARVTVRQDCPPAGAAESAASGADVCFCSGDSRRYHSEPAEVARFLGLDRPVTAAVPSSAAAVPASAAAGPRQDLQQQHQQHQQSESQQSLMPMGAAPSSPTGVTAAQVPHGTPAHTGLAALPPPMLPLPAPASPVPRAASGGAEGNAQEAKMMRTLDAFIAKLGGGALAPGWRCVVKARTGPHGNVRCDAYYTSPEGNHFRSKLEVARHLGLAAPKQAAARRPMSPGVSVDMAEEEVAAMLMALPHAQPGRSSKGRPVQWRLPSGIGQIAAEDHARKGTPPTDAHAPAPPNAIVAAAGGGAPPEQPTLTRRISNGLASMAEAIEQASPFVPRLKAEADGEPEGGAFSGGIALAVAAAEEDEESDQQRERLEKHKRLQMGRLRLAAAEAGLALDACWTVEARIRQNGTTAGTVDYYYRNGSGKTLRSVPAVLKLLSGGGNAAAAPPAPAPLSHAEGTPAETPTARWRPPPVSGAPLAASSPTAPPASPRPYAAGLASLLDWKGITRPALPPVRVDCKGSPAAQPQQQLQLVPSPGSGGSQFWQQQPSSPAGAARPGVKSGGLAALVQGLIGGAGFGPSPGQAATSAAAKSPALTAGGSLDLRGLPRAGGSSQQPASPASPSGRAGGGALQQQQQLRSPGGGGMGGKRSPKSGQKRRGGQKRRVDYATLEALADLQYEMNKDDGKASRRKRSKAKAGEAGAADKAKPGKTGKTAGAAPSKSAPAAVDTISVQQHAAGNEADPSIGAPRVRKERVKTPYTRLANRARTLISRIRVEQAYVDAYEGEGWRGANREKVRSAADLEHARLQIERCKLGIRDAVRECEESGGDKAIAEEHFDGEDGEIDELHIFCAKCLDPESYEENDIILCDGACHRAYHEHCLEPLLDAAALPEDEGWLCPACDAKAEILMLLNDEYGFEYEQETPWTAVFAEAPPATPRGGQGGAGGTAKILAAAGPVGAGTLADWLAANALEDSDSDDASYRDSGDEMGARGGVPDGEDEVSSIDASGDSCHSGDETSGSSGTEKGSASEDSQASGDRRVLQHQAPEVAGRRRMLRSVAGVPAPSAAKTGAAGATNKKRGAAEQGIASISGEGASVSEGEDAVVLEGKRRRSAVDYRRLNAEMFGDFESYEGEGSDDKDFSPRDARKGRAAAFSP